MRNENFWQWFNQQAAPRLAMREISFRRIFDYLDTFDRPVCIVETGCARLPGNWEGDGQSTVLFDEYIKCKLPGSIVHTVDLDPKATDFCKSVVSDKVIVHTGDSVRVLREIGAQLTESSRTIDLLYLDSYDVDWDNPIPSAVHHLKELVSIIPWVRPETLVVVDDCALICHAVFDAQDKLHLLATHTPPPLIGGKGLYVAQYATQVSAKIAFSHYQVGWTHLV